MVLSPTSGSADRSPSTKLSRRMMDDVQRRAVPVPPPRAMLLRLLLMLPVLAACTLRLDDDAADIAVPLHNHYNLSLQ